jgi:hypothetical protein
VTPSQGSISASYNDLIEESMPYHIIKTSPERVYTDFITLLGTTI